MAFDLVPGLFSAPAVESHSALLGLCEALPLHIILQILVLLGDTGDLARLCRTCKLLNYLATNLLYRRITLSLSNDDGLSPFQVGVSTASSGSSFAMGLNALVTRKTSGLVEYLHLTGGSYHAREDEPVSNPRGFGDEMILNVAIRAAVQNCQNLKQFKWTLNRIRPMLTVYSGLPGLSNLRVLHVQLPSKQETRAPCTVPPLPQLRQLAITNYDTDCYPDDFSTLLLEAVQLESLTTHFSPRMRKAHLPAPFKNLFWRLMHRNRVLKLRSLAIFNAYTNSCPEASNVMDLANLVDLTVIGSFYGSQDTSARPHAVPIFDDSMNKPGTTFAHIKSLRLDRLNHQVLQDIGCMRTVEAFYFVHASSQISKPQRRRGRNSLASTPSSADSPTVLGPPVEVNRPATQYQPGPTDLLRDSLMDTLGRVSGARLKHLILPTKYPVRPHNLATLLALCQNIVQIAFAMDEVDPETIRRLGPSARKLQCFRLLAPDGPGPEGKEQNKRFMEFAARDDHGPYFEMELSGMFGANPLDSVQIRYLGVHDKVWEAGTLYQESKTIVDEFGDSLETKSFRRSVKQIALHEVEHIEIWKYDTVDVE